MHTIDQHKLVSLLYEGVLSSIAAARGAMARGDISGKCNAIGKAIRIIEEGLLTALDRDAGGELAENLGSVYEYSLRQLVLANAHNDDAKLEEVAQLIQPIASGWEQIKETAQGMHATAASRISDSRRNGGAHA
jgi:flagellar protein FliS